MGACYSDSKEDVKQSRHNTNSSSTGSKPGSSEELALNDIVKDCFDKFDKDRDGYLNGN